MDTKELNICKALKKEDLSFLNLKEKIHLSEQELYSKIKKLMKRGFVVNYYSKKEGTDEYSFYQLTSFGKDRLRYSI